jgi:hypothetical protein
MRKSQQLPRGCGPIHGPVGRVITGVAGLGDCLNLKKEAE